MTRQSEEQQAAEGEVEEIRQEGGPFVVAAEETRMPMVFMDAKAPDAPIIFANDSFLALTGYGRDEVLGHSFNFLMAQGTDPKALALVEAAFEGTDDHSSEVRYRRKDGSMFWAALFISPVRDESGDVIQHFASFIDMTRHKEEQAQSRMLIDELNHRVKNTLTTVQSIVSQGLRNASDPAEIREAIETRLFALSRSHDLLTSENWESAGLHDVVEAALEPFGVANGRSERFRVTGKNVRFAPKAALALGIAFHDQGKLDEAAAAFREAIRLKSDYAAAHSNLGMALTDHGRIDEAAWNDAARAIGGSVNLPRCLLTPAPLPPR